MGPNHHLWFFAFTTASLWPELIVSMGPWPHLLFFVFKAATLAPQFQVSMGLSPHLWFLHAKQDFWIGIKYLFGSQTSPMVLWMQNSVISSRKTSLNGTQTSTEILQAKQRLLDQNYKSLWFPDLTYVFFAFTTATSAPELQISLGVSSHLLLWEYTTATLWPELIVSMGPRPHLSFSACKTAWLAPELLVSIGPSPHLWFLHAKQRL